MKKVLILAIASTLLAGAPAISQLGGGVDSGGMGQPMHRSLEMAMMDLANESQGVTREALQKSYGEEELADFLDTSVVRVSLDPVGLLVAEYLQGGEVLEVKFGSKKVKTGDEIGDWASEVIVL